ncbi:MAG: hypothetical protein NPIRA05_01420 [Nitrospirales bacterium]|nr:MAG: hypothetical protein NPIRA05_01420 [Nitrospirales bacterium]
MAASASKALSVSSVSDMIYAPETINNFGEMSKSIPSQPDFPGYGNPSHDISDTRPNEIDLAMTC